MSTTHGPDLVFRKGRTAEGTHLSGRRDFRADERNILWFAHVGKGFYLFQNPLADPAYMFSTSVSHKDVLGTCHAQHRGGWKSVSESML